MVHFYCPYCLNEIEYLNSSEYCGITKYYTEDLEYTHGSGVEAGYVDLTDEQEEGCDNYETTCPECGRELSLDEVVVIDDDGEVLERGDADDSDIETILRNNFDIDDDFNTDDDEETKEDRKEKVRESIKHIEIKPVNNKEWKELFDE